jgi:hypothetical protein
MVAARDSSCQREAFKALERVYDALNMFFSKIRAITNAEFVQMMGKCRPPTGWPSTIGL